MRILDSQGVGKTVRHVAAGIMGVILTVACAPVPIQEMSDARQAIMVARESVAGSESSRKVQRAQLLLEQAEIELRDGKYAQARKVAVQAKLLAIEAREESAGGTASQ